MLEVGMSRVPYLIRSMDDFQIDLILPAAPGDISPAVGGGTARA
jgi:hypothetical protein